MDFPALMDSQMEEIQQRERLEKIQTYRLIRDNVLEHQKQQRLNRKQLRTHHPEINENMQVSEEQWGHWVTVQKSSFVNINVWESEGDMLSASSPSHHPVTYFSLPLLWQHCKIFLDACEALRNRQKANIKMEHEAKQPMEEAQQAALEKTTPDSAATQQPNKRAKSAGKKKWWSLASLSALLNRHFSTILKNPITTSYPAPDDIIPHSKIDPAPDSELQLTHSFEIWN